MPTPAGNALVSSGYDADSASSAPHVPWLNQSGEYVTTPSTFTPYDSAMASALSALWPPCEWPITIDLSEGMPGTILRSARRPSSTLLPTSSLCAYPLGGFPVAP